MFKLFNKSKPKKEKIEITKTSRVPETFVEAAAAFERSKIEDIKRSNKIAWRIVIVSTSITTISIIAFLVALIMRTEPEPVILQVDQSTGATTLMKSIRDSRDQYAEVINKYWLADYIRSREGYDWWTLSQQFEKVKLMSMDDVASQYSREVQSPTSPLKTIKEKGKISVNIISITFIQEVAQIRFTTEKQNTDGNVLDGAPLQKWIATVAYKFDSGFMTEQQRLVNPLGFKVISYRVDPEVLK